MAGTSSALNDGNWYTRLKCHPSPKFSRFENITNGQTSCTYHRYAWKTWQNSVLPRKIYQNSVVSRNMAANTENAIPNAIHHTISLTFYVFNDFFGFYGWWVIEKKILKYLFIIGSKKKRKQCDIVYIELVRLTISNLYNLYSHNFSKQQYYLMHAGVLYLRSENYCRKYCRILRSLVTSYMRRWFWLHPMNSPGLIFCQSHSYTSLQVYNDRGWPIQSCINKSSELSGNELFSPDVLNANCNTY